MQIVFPDVVFTQCALENKPPKALLGAGKPAEAKQRHDRKIFINNLVL